jgi:hypothetical protein
VRRVRRLGRQVVAVFGFASILAACSSTPATAPPTGSTASSGVTTTTGVPDALTPPPTSGPLSAAASIETGLPSTDTVLVIEAPDGTIYFACVSEGCSGSSGSPSEIWAVVRDEAPQVVERVPGVVMSLAASQTELFVATNTTITAFERSTGSAEGTWPDPPGVTASGSFFPTVSLAFGGGQLWALYGISTDESGYEPSDLERIDPASASTQVVSTDVGTAGLAVGASGAFFGDFKQNALEAVSPTGVTTATSGALAAYPNQVALQAQIGGALVALDLAATGAIQSSVLSYSATTLGQPSSVALAGLTSGEDAAIESTLAGPLLVVGGCNGTSEIADGAVGSSAQCQPVTTLARLSVTAGTTSDPLSIPGAVALIGPYPVVVTFGASGISLVRVD